METKASIRTKYKILRNAMPENIVREESQRICQNISTWEIFQKAQNCFFYYPLGKEASLLPFFKESIQKEQLFPGYVEKKWTFVKSIVQMIFRKGIFM